MRAADLWQLLTWFRSCLMECCSVRMWLNSGLCRVSLKLPRESLWVHSSLWTSLDWRRSRAARTCWRSTEDTEHTIIIILKKCYRAFLSKAIVNRVICTFLVLSYVFTCWDIFKHCWPCLSRLKREENNKIRLKWLHQRWVTKQGHVGQTEERERRQKRRRKMVMMKEPKELEKQGGKWKKAEELEAKKN